VHSCGRRAGLREPGEEGEVTGIGPGRWAGVAGIAAARPHGESSPGSSPRALQPIALPVSGP